MVMDKPDAIIVDRDGTLASVEYIRPDAQDKLPKTRAEKDAIKAQWAAFNAALPFDAPVPAVVEMLDAVPQDVKIIVVSGRMEGDYPGDRHRRRQVLDWLHKHDIPFNRLFMRSGGDQRKDSIVKE